MYKQKQNLAEVLDKILKFLSYLPFSHIVQLSET